MMLAIKPDEVHDSQPAAALLADVTERQMLVADQAYDADWLRDMVAIWDSSATIPPERNRRSPICFSPVLYKARNAVERFFKHLEYDRRIATRYDKLGGTHPAMIKLAAVRIR